MARMVMMALGVVVTCMVVAAPYAEAAVSCTRVAASLAACVPYLRTGGALTPGCCSGIRAINASAKTTGDRQATCNCLQNTLQSAAGAISGINFGLMAGLPQSCGVNLPYTISVNTDCSQLQ